MYQTDWLVRRGEVGGFAGLQVEVDFERRARGHFRTS